MKIEWNKVTWRSTSIAIIIFIGADALFFILGDIYGQVNNQTPHFLSKLYFIFNNNFFSSTFGLLLAALIAGYLGFGQYRKQKIYDSIHKRYIQSIDDFIFHINNNRIISENNYGTILQKLRNFRDRPPDEFKIWLNSRAFEPESVSPHMPHSFFIVSQMFQNEAFQKIAIKNLVDLSADNDFFISEAPLYLEMQINIHPEKYENEATRLDLVEKLKREVQMHRDRIEEDKLHQFISILESVSFLAKQANIDSYKKLDNISELPIIKAKLKELEELEVPSPKTTSWKVVNKCDT